MRFAGDLEAIVQIEDGMEDGVLVIDLDDRPVGKDVPDALLEHLPFVVAVEIVGHEESAAQKVIAYLFSLLLGESPLADLHGVEPGPVVDVVALVEIPRL